MKILYENKFFLFDDPVRTGLKYTVKQCLYPLVSWWYAALTKILLPKESSQKKYNVSICAIFRDEAEILKEWIEFHRIVGVDHFYLYNNFSADNYKKILEPYVTEGIVTLTDWPYERQQMAAYKDCAERYRDESKWIGFIDLDEFVVPNGQNQTIYDFLQKFEKKAAFLVIYWRYFGSSALVERDKNKLVTESFTNCWYKYADIGKYFWNTRFSYNANEKHQTGYMHTRWGSVKGVSIPPMNEFGKYILFGLHKGAKEEFPIQINHYVIKSFNEYKEKKAKRGGGVHAIQEGFHDTKYFFDHEKYCQSTDYRIFKFLSKLKLNCKNGGGYNCRVVFALNPLYAASSVTRRAA